jgi:hypothetical protein
MLAEFANGRMKDAVAGLIGAGGLESSH